MEHYTDIPILGIIGYDKDLEIPERHLGLVPANESIVADKVIKKLSDAISSGVDLQKIIPIFSGKSNLYHSDIDQRNSKVADIKIAIAKDAAFGFLRIFKKNAAIARSRSSVLLGFVRN